MAGARKVVRIPPIHQVLHWRGFGAGVQSAIFFALTRWFGVPDFVTLGGLSFAWALGWAILGVLASNSFFNRYWTFGGK